jgi:protein-tyrosine phosphatase
MPNAHNILPCCALMLLFGSSCQEATKPDVQAAREPEVSAQPDAAPEATAPAADASAQPSEATQPPEMLAVRTVLEAHVENARGLGGIPAASQGVIKPGLLFRGPPLAGLTEAGCSAVAELGLRTVVDLRVESEVTLRPDDACVLDSAQLVAAPLPIPYNVSGTDYIADLDASESIAKVFEVLGDEARYPVYVHCTWGRDRTGVLMAVVLLTLGVAPELIMHDYLVSEETVGAYPSSLQAALDEIAARGGVDAYLAAAGVSAQQIEVLRAHAIERSGN